MKWIFKQYRVLFGRVLFCFKIIWLLLAFLQISSGLSFAGAKKVNILIRMMDTQDQWFRNRIIPAAEKELGVKINAITYNRLSDIEEMVRLEKKSGKHTIALIKTEMSQVRTMVRLGYVLPLNDIIDPVKLKKEMAEYSDNAVNFATINGKVYYVPRKLETNTFLYKKSKLKEAINRWPLLAKQINEMFKKHNGYGLPSDYELETDPGLWDWYDLAVVSFCWSHTKGEFGLTMPRMVHRGRNYGGTTIELLTKLYQINGSNKDILAMDTQPVLDLFEWESFYVENNLYNNSMWIQRWSGGDIWGGFASGQVYGAFMHQVDAFSIHERYLKDPLDLGVAIMPGGASMELDKKGKPVRLGGHVSNFAGWWWGIPVTTPDAKLSYDIARFITSYKIHLEECLKFGMIPIRKDISEKIDKKMLEPWKRNILKTAMLQYASGTRVLPLDKDFSKISSIWRKAWFNIVTKKQYSDNGDGVDINTIKKRLKLYSRQCKDILQ